MDDEPRAKSLLAALCGAIDRHVKQRPRDTIVRNAREDPAKPLAQRVSESDACDFCSQFANAEPVDPAKVSEKFHAYCKCHFMLFFQETRYRGRFVDDDALESVGITIEEGATPDYYEKRDGLVMAALGHRVEYRAPFKSGPRMADTLVDGERVEFKNPTSSGLFTVQNQILSNLYGKNKAVFKPQSDVLLISNVRNSMTMAEMQESLAFAFGSASKLTAEEMAYMRKIILLDERTRRVRVYEMKNADVARLLGPRRRQGNISRNASLAQGSKGSELLPGQKGLGSLGSPKPSPRYGGYSSASDYLQSIGYAAESMPTVANEHYGEVVTGELLGLKKGPPMPFADADSGKVNPDYNMGGGYTMNCQSAVVAYVARRKGWDVQAISAMQGSVCEQLSHDVTMAWRRKNGGYVTRLDYKNFSNKESAQELFDALDRSIKPGRLYTLDFNWKGTGAHICAIERDGKGMLFIYDAQTSRVLYGERMMSFLTAVDPGFDVMLLDVTDLELDRWVAENVLRRAV